MISLYSYAYELLKLNRERLLVPAWQTSVEWGLVAELAEYTEAKVNYELDYSDKPDLQTVVKEAGDVLAFVVLVLAKDKANSLGKFFTGTDDDLLVVAGEVDLTYHENYGYFVDSETATRELASHFFRKYNRVNYSVPVVSIVSAMEGILKDLRPHSITLAHIAEVNLQKLTDRANRGKLFEGSGNNR